jgi:hypothetical protein
MFRMPRRPGTADGTGAQGWCVYFRPGVFSRTFAHLRYYTWRQVGSWLRRKQHRSA